MGSPCECLSGDLWSQSSHSLWLHIKPPGNTGKSFFWGSVSQLLHQADPNPQGPGSDRQREPLSARSLPPPLPPRALGPPLGGLFSALGSQLPLGKGKREGRKVVQPQVAGTLRQGTQRQFLPGPGRKRCHSVHSGIRSLLVSSSLGTHWTLDKDWFKSWYI